MHVSKNFQPSKILIALTDCNVIKRINIIDPRKMGWVVSNQILFFRVFECTKLRSQNRLDLDLKKLLIWENTFLSLMSIFAETAGEYETQSVPFQKS